YKLEQNDVVAVLVHIASTKVPYKGVGKESIAPVEELRKEIEAAVQEVARRLRVYLTKKRKRQEAQEKLRIFMKYIPEIAQNLAYLASNEEKNYSSLAKEIESTLIEMAKKKIRIQIEQTDSEPHIVQLSAEKESAAEVSDPSEDGGENEEE
ncbi:MAG: hypothetical protein QXO53_05300, partial [Fervidicoccaceae archaeon]